MMCDSCKFLGEMNRDKVDNPGDYATNHRKQVAHVRGKGVRCEYPDACTCQHRMIPEGE